MLQALEQVRRMRGGSQSQLMRCDDQNLYVVKFQNNPQGLRVLVNELVAGRLASRIGLPVPAATVVNVEERLIALTDELVIQMQRSRGPCSSGVQFASRYLGPPEFMRVYDLLPSYEMKRVDNPAQFCGMLAFDKWTCNTDGRQVVFVQRIGDTLLEPQMIDQGFCFGACNWDFPDAPLRGIYLHHDFYQQVRSIDSFEPWLTRIESLTNIPSPESILDEVPSEWCDRDRHLVARMLERLFCRRTRVRDLIEQTRKAAEDVFPNWKVPYFLKTSGA